MKRMGRNKKKLLKEVEIYDSSLQHIEKADEGDGEN